MPKKHAPFHTVDHFTETKYSDHSLILNFDLDHVIDADMLLQVICRGEINLLAPEVGAL